MCHVNDAGWVSRRVLELGNVTVETRETLLEGLASVVSFTILVCVGRAGMGMGRGV